MSERRFPNFLQQRVENRSVQFLAVPDAYKLRPGASWLWRGLWRLLKRAGQLETHFEEVEVVTYSGLQSKTMLDAIMEALNHSSRELPDNPTLVIGAEDYAEMTHDPQALAAFSYRAGPFHRSNYPDVFGVQVKVIPWLKGWAIL